MTSITAVQAITTAFQAIVFIWYVDYIHSRFGTLSSISASTYALSGNRRYLFFVWLLSIAVANYFQDMGFYGFVMSIGFVAAGLTVDHKKSPTPRDEIHTGATVSAIVAGFLGLIVLYGIWVPAVIMILGGFILYKATPKNWIWYAEILAMAMLTVGLFMR